MRHFGWIKVDDARAVGTNFYHLGGLPLWPSNSEIVDRSTMQVDRERGWLGITETARYQAVEIPRHRRSVIAGYLRTWGVVLGLAALAGLTRDITLMGIGGLCLVVGRGIGRLFSFRHGDPIMIAGAGIVLGVGIGMVMPLPLLLVLALVAGLALQWTRGFTYRDAPPKPRIARSPLTIPKAVARIQPPAPPVIVPLQAPERVEASTEAPRFLT